MDLSLDALLRTELSKLEAEDLRRSLRALPPEMAPGRNFAGNDYLGLSRHPVLMEAARRATSTKGTGAGASRLITGTSPQVLELEESLATWKEKPAALVFGSGYAAALGTLPALLGPGDTVILDKLSHACLIDAARLSRATIRVFPHNQLGKLEALLQRLNRSRSGDGGRVLIVTESIFSMDGDAAPLRELVDIKDRHGAWLLVDEAHATGLYGPRGAGLISEAGLSERVDIIMGTMSKALGSVGGYIAGSRTLIDWLVNRARSFIYSTALPPGAIAASQAAVELARGEDGRHLRETLIRRISYFKGGLPLPWRDQFLPAGAIQPLICGESRKALQASGVLLDHGFIVPAIRFPTVPRGAARLRVTLSALHTEPHIQAFHKALAAL